MSDNEESLEWIANTDTLAPDYQIVMTKIDTEAGVRNEQLLKRQGNLWFTPDGEMYVYYSPTHWKPSTREQLQGVIKEVTQKTDQNARLIADVEAQMEGIS